MIKISYSIDKCKLKSIIWHTYICRVYKNIEAYNSYGCKKLFEGTFKECQNYCKENNIDLRRVIKI